MRALPRVFIKIFIKKYFKYISPYQKIKSKSNLIKLVNNFDSRDISSSQTIFEVLKRYDPYHIDMEVMCNRSGFTVYGVPNAKAWPLR